jgi:hypothetical protein
MSLKIKVIYFLLLFFFFLFLNLGIHKQERKGHGMEKKDDEDHCAGFCTADNYLSLEKGHNS